MLPLCKGPLEELCGSKLCDGESLKEVNGSPAHILFQVSHLEQTVDFTEVSFFCLIYSHLSKPVPQHKPKEWVMEWG